MAESKTRPTRASVSEYIASTSDRATKESNTGDSGPLASAGETRADRMPGPVKIAEPLLATIEDHGVEAAVQCG
jgi:hypothetical protein